MLFNGVIESFNSTPHQLLTRLATDFEKAGCTVVRERCALQVKTIGLDSLVFPAAQDLPHFSAFADKIEFKIHPDGSLQYRANYWSQGQMMLHGLITLTAVLSYFFHSDSIDRSTFLSYLVLANAIPCLGAVLSLFYWKYLVIAPLRS